MNDFERQSYLCIWLALLAIVIFSAIPAYAHDMPGTHIPYFPGCCNAYDGHSGDCMPISDDAVQQNGDGTYTVKASGEVFLAPVSANSNEPIDGNWEWLPGGKAHKVGSHARWSPDGQFHRCFHNISDPTDGSYCLYVVPPGT